MIALTGLLSHPFFGCNLTRSNSVIPNPDQAGMIISLYNGPFFWTFLRWSEYESSVRINKNMTDVESMLRYYLTLLLLGKFASFLSFADFFFQNQLF